MYSAALFGQISSRRFEYEGFITIITIITISLFVENMTKHSIYKQFHITMQLNAKVGLIKNSNENLVSLWTRSFDTNKRNGHWWERGGNEGKGEKEQSLFLKNFLNVDSERLLVGKTNSVQMWNSFRSQQPKFNSDIGVTIN